MKSFCHLGSLYDANGNATGSILLNSSWLLADSAEKFSNLTDCLVLDYNQYCYQLPNFTKAQLGLENGEEQNEEQNETQEEISPLFSNCVDGEKTLGENIADLDGIKVKLSPNFYSQTANLLKLKRLGRIHSV